MMLFAEFNNQEKLDFCVRIIRKIKRKYPTKI